MQGVGVGRGLTQRKGLVQALFVVDALFQHQIGHAAVQKRVVRFSLLDGLAQNELAHDERDEIHAAKTHVVGVAAAASVHFEEAEATVSTVELDVEVCEAAIADVLQDLGGIVDDDLLLLADNGKWVAKSRGVVVLQGDNTARNHAQVALGIREGG